MWCPPPKFCTASRPLGKRARDGGAAWLYGDADETGAVSAGASQRRRRRRAGLARRLLLLSALALATRDSAVCDDLIDDTCEDVGIYGVTLCVQQKVDNGLGRRDFPCWRPWNSHGKRRRPKPIYATSSDHREIWPNVVEKAAKVAGSYEAVGRGARRPSARDADRRRGLVRGRDDDPVEGPPARGRGLTDVHSVAAGLRRRRLEHNLSERAADRSRRRPDHAYSWPPSGGRGGDAERDRNALPQPKSSSTKARCDSSSCWRKAHRGFRQTGTAPIVGRGRRVVFWINLPDFYANASAGGDLATLSNRAMIKERNKPRNVGAPDASVPTHLCPADDDWPAEIPGACVPFD